MEKTCLSMTTIEQGQIWSYNEQTVVVLILDVTDAKSELYQGVLLYSHYSLDANDLQKAVYRNWTFLTSNLWQLVV